MSEQNSLNLEDTGGVDSVEKYKFEPIKGYPMLHWRGKRPFTNTQYYPAQKKEVYGEAKDGVYFDKDPVTENVSEVRFSQWINKIFWGDNLQVMSHLLKEYRGKVDLVYIDPPFDSKATYGKKVKLRGKSIASDTSTFEEKQYTDIWSNDEYLQFMYERLVIMRELLSEKGSIFVHCDPHKNHHLRCLLDEVFGEENFVNEIIWNYRRWTGNANNFLGMHDNIYFYSKTDKYIFNEMWTEYTDNSMHRKKNFHTRIKDGDVYETAVNEKGVKENDVWNISVINSQATERTGYPTQKPEALLERIVQAASSPGSIVFDCFMGSGTLQAVAMKMGRRFIGSDINLGAVQTTTKRLIQLKDKIKKDLLNSETLYTDFELYNVNNYDVFRNPLEAKSLLLEALEIDTLTGGIYDGERDGYMVKVMPVNRIATREDLNELVANFPYKVFEQRKEQNPTKPVESIMLICMGHESDLKAHLEQECGYKLNVEVVDILRDKSNIEFKRDSEAEFKMDQRLFKVLNFYPMNLMQKLSLQKESVSEWRELVESIVIDWNYDGAAMEPTVVDIPDKNEFVLGEYEIPEDAGTIKIKITDLLSESYEEVIKHG